MAANHAAWEPLAGVRWTMLERGLLIYLSVFMVVAVCGGGSASTLPIDTIILGPFGELGAQISPSDTDPDQQPVLGSLGEPNRELRVPQDPDGRAQDLFSGHADDEQQGFL